MTKTITKNSSRILHVRKDRNYDYVYVNKKKIMLGKSGTPEAHTAFLAIQGKLFADPTLSSIKPQQVVIDTARRKTKIQPSQIQRKEQRVKNPRRKDRDSHDRNSYNRAIQQAITAANKRLSESEQIPHWTPYQLRHAAITDIVQQTGKLDIARAVAGQKTISVIQGYNHADVKIAIEQAVLRSR